MAKFSFTVAKSGTTATKSVTTKAGTISQAQKAIANAYAVPTHKVTLKAK